MATPGVPPERLAALRKALKDTVADPEFVAFAAERHIDLGPALDGEGLARVVAETLSVTPDVVAQVKRARGD
jgi:tripartite-type tricarboxylate transporter receptor subunit TctC